MKETMKFIKRKKCDIRSYFRPLYWTCQLFGISVMSLASNKVFRVLNLCYSLINMCFVIGYTIYCIGFVPSQFGHQNAVSVSVQNMQQIMGITVLFFIYYQVILYKSKIEKIFNIFTQIDLEFQLLNIRFNYKKFERKIIIELVFVVLFIYSLFFVLRSHYEINYLDSIISEYITNIHAIFLIDIVLLMFINFCWHIKCKLTTIKLLLLDLSGIDETSMIERDEMWKIKFVQETPKLFIREIRIIATIFERLFKTVNILNNIFGFSNLMTMGELIELKQFWKKSKFITFNFSF